MQARFAPRILSTAVFVAAFATHGNAAEPPRPDDPSNLSTLDPREQALRTELQDILQAPELQGALAGVHVRSLRDGHTVFERNSTRLFNPASNMKLLTTAAALWYLGPSYRFKTEARYSGELKAGVVDGDLYIKGYGDPTLTTEELFGFVNDIALAGVQKVQGDLIIDDSFFDNVHEGPGWDQEDSDHAYAAPIGPLSINFNTFELRILPGQSVGEPARVAVWPDVPSIEVMNTAETRGARTRTRLWLGTSRRDDNGVRVTVRGAIALNDATGRIERRRVNDPSRFAGEAIMSLLKMRGVEVKGRVKFSQAPRRTSQPIAYHWSKPLAEVTSTLNKYSNNVMAEMIFKTLGAELGETQGSWATGSKVIRDFLMEIGIKDDSFVIGNGSGLNDINRITPSQITLVLEAMYRRFEVQAEFVASLAVAGNSGTITGRFENSPAVSRLRAKTGSLTGVSALSGYVVTRNDEVLAFSVLMNDYPGRARTMWSIQDRIGIALARYQGQEVVARP